MDKLLDKKTVFVTGATGFIGGALCERLLAEGANVRGLGRNPERLAALGEVGVEAVGGDVADDGLMSSLVRDADIVFHLAAFTGPGSTEQYQRVNHRATRRLAEACAEMGVERFVYTSSIAALGFIGEGEIDETKPLEEYGDFYGDSKIAAERALNELMHTADMDIVIARPGMVYGPRSPGWSLRILKVVRAGSAPLIGGGDGTSYPIYIDNLVDGLMLCATHPDAPGETFNLVDDPVTWAQYFGAFEAMLGRPGVARRVPRWAVNLGVAVLDPLVRRRNLRYAADMLGGRGVISNRKAKELLGWRPGVSLAEGMRRTEEWLHEAGYL